MNKLVTVNQSISTKRLSWSPMEYTWGFESWLWCIRRIVDVISLSLFQERISACAHEDAYWVYWITQTSQSTFLLCVVSFGRCYVWYFCLCKPRTEACEEDQTWKIFTVKLQAHADAASREWRPETIHWSSVAERRRASSSIFIKIVYSVSFLSDSRIILTLRCLRKHYYCELCVMKSYL